MTTKQEYIIYDEYKPESLTASKPESKQIPNSIPAQNYHVINLEYNYGTEESPIFRPFEMELCEFHTSTGVISKSSNNPDKMDESIMIKFDINNKEQFESMDAIRGVYTKCASILAGVKGIVKMHTFDSKTPESGFRNPIYYPRDDVTGEIIPGRSPSTFLKLFNRTNNNNTEQTLFVDPKNKPVDKKLLLSVEMSFIPLIHFKRLYIGSGKCILQMEMKSAIITDIRPRNTQSKQIYTINKLNQNNPELENKVASQLARLTADKQETLLPAPTINSNQQTKESEQSTLNDIHPTNSVSQFPSSIQEAVNKAPKRKEFKIPI